MNYVKTFTWVCGCIYIVMTICKIVEGADLDQILKYHGRVKSCARVDTFRITSDLNLVSFPYSLLLKIKKLF